MLLTGNIYEKIQKYLKLDKPLIIFDIETTGTHISADKIISLSLTKIRIDGRSVRIADYLFDPEIPIEPESTTIHGITNEQIQGQPKFFEKAQELFQIFSGCYYSGFNVKYFDLPILRREFIRAGLDFDYDEKQVIDSKVIYKYMLPRTLSAAYFFYCRKEFNDKHSSRGDTDAAAEILLKQLEKYKEVRNWDFLNKLHSAGDESDTDSSRKFYWRDGEAYFAFSQYHDFALSEIVEKDPEFLKWMLSADFSRRTKNIVRAALEEKGIL